MAIPIAPRNKILQSFADVTLFELNVEYSVIIYPRIKAAKPRIHVTTLNMVDFTSDPRPSKYFHKST